MKIFSRNNPFDVFNNFKHNQIFVKTMFKSLNANYVAWLLENDWMTSKRRHMSDSRPHDTGGAGGAVAPPAIFELKTCPIFSPRRMLSALLFSFNLSTITKSWQIDRMKSPSVLLVSTCLDYTDYWHPVNIKCLW